jgi:hypothetical protein
MLQLEKEFKKKTNTNTQRHTHTHSVLLSLIAVSVECNLLAHILEEYGIGYSSCVRTLRFIRRLMWWKPKLWRIRLLLAPSSHSRKGRIARGRTLWTDLIDGSQELVSWPTHQTLARLSVSLASAMQLTMTIRSRPKPTTSSYPCSPSFTNEHSSTGVSRSEGEGKEWVGRLGGC